MYPIFKRLLDIFLSIIGVVILFPVLIIVSMFVLKYHGKPVLFVQKRPGKYENIFKMYKFRTMTNATDNLGNLLPDEDRLTKFGRILRKTSLDELPELFNVIKGDMSLVGPRPLLVKYLPHYTEQERKRHLIRPGITGLAQISGRNFIDWDKRLALDVEYIEKISFYIDLKILILTIKSVLYSSNVSVNSSEVEPSLIDYRTNNK